MALDKVVELGNLLAKQWRKGEFKLEKVRNRRELTICEIEGNKKYNCKNDDEVRNVVVNIAKEWIREKLVKSDLEEINTLISECEALDLKPEVLKPRTEKGITFAAIKAKAEEKGYKIWKEGGKTFVLFPGSDKPYHYNLSMIATARNLGIVEGEALDERVQKDERFA